MSELVWIVLGGLLMTSLALVGSVTLLLDPRTLERALLPMVGLAAGSLLGGALFHMLPTALAADASLAPYLWLVTGFTIFYALEQFLHRHHEHSAMPMRHEPVTYLVLLGDALHNFLGGLAVAGAFLVDVRVGVTTWLAAAAHEIPQELGDFAVLVHGGWSRRRALAFNVLSASTFLLGGLIAYAASFTIDVAFLLPLAAGNFLYIAAADLIPETHRTRGPKGRTASLLAFVFGVALLYALATLER